MAEEYNKKGSLFFKGAADLDRKLKVSRLTGHFPALRFLSSQIWLQGNETSCNLLTNVEGNDEREMTPRMKEEEEEEGEEDKVSRIFSSLSG